MPIFMDRHDLSDKVTAEVVAELHKADLKVQDQFGCRGLTYWFDGERGTAFCLVEAPNKKALKQMHRYAHGQVPNQIIEVDPQTVTSFLGRIEDPQNTKEASVEFIHDSAFRILMVIGFNHIDSLKNTSDKQKIEWAKYSKLISKILKTNNRNIIQHSENYFLIPYKLVSAAINNAFNIKTKLREELEKDGLSLKIALSAGDPVANKASFFGDAIKLAERMCKVNKGTIIVSSEVKDLWERESVNTFEKETELTSLTSADEKFLTELMEFTEDSWYDPNLKVIDLCKCVHCSKSQFFRKMITLFGQSPNRFLREYRLAEALSLLNKKDRTVAEIAYQSGFSSPSYFTRCFERKYGYSPTQYLA